MSAQAQENADCSAGFGLSISVSASCLWLLPIQVWLEFDLEVCSAVRELLPQIHKVEVCRTPEGETEHEHTVSRK